MDALVFWRRRAAGESANSGEVRETAAGSRAACRGQRVETTVLRRACATSRTPPLLAHASSCILYFEACERITGCGWARVGACGRVWARVGACERVRELVESTCACAPADLRAEERIDVRPRAGDDLLAQRPDHRQRIHRRADQIGALREPEVTYEEKMNLRRPRLVRGCTHKRPYASVAKVAEH
eukprot:3853440-Pleurochrysis_carterae.AAC.1